MIAAGGARGRVVDAHLHLWRLPREPGDSPYTWITPDLTELHRDVTPEQAGAELAAAGVAGAVLVQADDTVADTRAMLRAADTHRWVLGVVGWVPLDSPAGTAQALRGYAAHPAFKGVRHLVHEDPRPDLLQHPDVRESLGLLATAGLPLDVPDAFPRHLGQLGDLVEDLPTLTVVVDHLGKPPLAQGPGSPAFARWEEQLRRVADAPHAVAKVSGLRVPGAAAYDLATLAPALDVALDAFGADRLMYGGDWPMTLPAGYRPTMGVLREWVATLAPADQRALWHGTATRVYGLRT